MKTKNLKLNNTIYLMVFVFCFLFQPLLGQDSSTSVKIIVNNLSISNNSKTISFDVYLKDVDNDNPIAVPSFVFRLKVPMSDIGASNKTITVTNPSSIGAITPTITTSGSDWLIKFNNDTYNPAMNYGSALMISDIGMGTRIGTINIKNENDTPFSYPFVFNANFAGTTMSLKSTVSIFIPNTINLALNSNTALLESSFIGLTRYTLTNSTGISNPNSNFNIYPNPTYNGFYVDVQNKTCEMIVYDFTGKKVLSQSISGRIYINSSEWCNGGYIVSIDGTHYKLIKE